MMWSALIVVMFISTSVAAQGEGATSNDAQQGAGNNAFLTNYTSILKELQTCAAPSENMFIRPKQQDGTLLFSEFDKFCYYLASRDNVALYLCQYYKMIVENYFGCYCKNTDKLKCLDTSAQYQSWLEEPSKACKMLQQRVMYQKQPLFPSADSCEAVCQQSLFCTNLAYLLSMWQRHHEQRRDLDDKVDYDYRPCEHFECYNGGTCMEKYESPRYAMCLCVEGFHGQQCEVDDSYSPCQYFECHNGATCIERYETEDTPKFPECLCVEGFLGEYCDEVDYDYRPCRNFICYNGGTCVDRFIPEGGAIFAECLCTEGFHGEYCDVGVEDWWDDPGKDPVEESSRWEYDEMGENGSHFLVYMVVLIILIITIYIVYHNKTKIKEYFGVLQQERKAKKNIKNVNYKVYIRLDQTR